MTFTPVKLTGLGNIAEHAPVCGMTLAAAIKYAKEAYGEDAGVVCDAGEYLANEICWMSGDPEEQQSN
jgi:hypothetical protein